LGFFGDYQYLGEALEVLEAWKDLIAELAEVVRAAQSALAALQHDQIAPELTAIESQCFYDCIQLVDSVLPKLPEDGFL
jgi:hypothetical protein